MAHARREVTPRLGRRKVCFEIGAATARRLDLAAVHAGRRRYEIVETALAEYLARLVVVDSAPEAVLTPAVLN